MNISYDSYRVFYYAAKYKSFSQAAAALYNNQPNVTRIIRRLESELRCALFFRSPQGVRLTPEGEKLYAHIAVAFESIEAAEEEIFSDQSLQSGVVHIAASGLALRGCLLQVLAQYRSEYPHVRICLTNHTTPQGLAAVQNGLADFAVVSEGAAVPDSLVMQKVGEIQEIPICGSAFSELAQEIFVQHYTKLTPKVAAALADKYQSDILTDDEIHSGVINYFLIYLGTEPVGYFALDLGPAGAMCLSRLFLKEKARGQGIGRSIVAYAQKLAEGDGRSRLYMKVWARDLKAEGFAKKCRFRKAETAPVEVLPGTTLDITTWEKLWR